MNKLQQVMVPEGKRVKDSAVVKSTRHNSFFNEKEDALDIIENDF